MKATFDERFARHQGIMSCEDQKKIKETTVGIGGLGLGGSIFINLVRLGFDKFRVADPDIYERSNVNRQRLAKESTLLQRKDQSLIAEAKDINPDITVKAWEEGITGSNVHSFLDGVDLAIDVIDVFALEEKILYNKTAREMRIPVASCGSLGFSGSIVFFDESSPSFEELTGMKVEKSYEENIQNFIRFLAPEVPRYMLEQMDQAMQGKGHIPFVVPGIEATAAICASEMAKHVIGLGNLPVAPEGIFLDMSRLELSIFKADYRARLLKIVKEAA